MCWDSLPAKAQQRNQTMTELNKNVARMTKNGGVIGARPVGVIAKGIRVRAWRALRALAFDNPHFTIGDLLDIVATGAEKDPKSSLKAYFMCLERYGVLSRLDRREATFPRPSPGRVIWKLEIDLGWDAPVWRTAQQKLWNPNTKSYITLPVAPKQEATQ